MAGIPYSGGPNIKADFAADTIADILAGITLNLLAANWVSSSGAPGDEILQSMVTSQGLGAKVRLYSGGAGIHTQIQFRNLLETRTGQDHYLTPSAGRVLRIIANPFMFVVLRPNALGSTSNGTFVIGGVPKLEDHMAPFVKECIFSHGDLASGAVNFSNSFRDGASVGIGNQSWHNVNGDMMPGQSWTSGNGIGKQSLLIPFGYTASGASQNDGGAGNLFVNGEGFKTPARICWGLTAANKEPHVRGYIWDGVATTGLYPMDVEDSYDSHTFYNITNLGGVGGLWLVVP